jgi:hypothetical protein
MEPVVALGIVSKLIGLGMKSWEAVCHHGFDQKDLDALRAGLEVGADVARNRKAGPADAATQHISLVLGAFGEALRRHWAYSRHTRMGLSRLFGDEKRRAEEVELRIRMSSLRLPQLGDRAPAGGEVTLVAELAGTPLGTPYFKALWGVFSNPRLTDVEAGEEAPLDVDEGTRREFERHFLLAYSAGLCSVAGAGVRHYLASLPAYRATLVRELLVADLASWGARHVFGNVRRADWPEAEPLPFLSLDDLYVEPRAALERPREQDERPRPVLALVEEQLARPDARLLVVKADFGSG